MGLNAMLEKEVKFDAPIALALPDLRYLVGRTVRLPEQQLITRYFDTTDRRLWQQGMTLRHRRTGVQGDGIWTLKLPHASDGQALERTEVTWPGSSNEIPTDVNRLLCGVIRREQLGHLTTLATIRQRLVLSDDQDNEVAELDDDVVTVVGGPRDGARFRQVELEFRGNAWNGKRVLRQLQKAGARLEKNTKLAKAIDLPERSSPEPAVDERSSLADIVRASLISCLVRLVTHDWQLRLTLPEPTQHDVHQARVATRRLRSDLKTFGTPLDPVWLKHVRSDLKWLGGVLGELRDLDVLFGGLSEPPLAVQQRLAVQRVEAGQRLAEALASGRYVDLVDRLHAASVHLPLAAGAENQAGRPAVDVLPSLVAARWRAVRRQVRKAGTHPSAAQLHRIRIKSKQLRYAAEAATPVIGKPARRTASAAEHVQTVLGKHHDAVSTEAWLRHEWTRDSSPGAVTLPSPAVSFEVGRLVAEACQRQRKAKHHWTAAWAELRRPKHRDWFPRR
jgi:CHAD domain-containing protein